MGPGFGINSLPGFLTAYITRLADAFDQIPPSCWLRSRASGCIVIHRMAATFSFAFPFRYWRTVADSRTSVI